MKRLIFTLAFICIFAVGCNTKEPTVNAGSNEPAVSGTNAADYNKIIADYRNIVDLRCSTDADSFLSALDSLKLSPELLSALDNHKQEQYPSGGKGRERLSTTFFALNQGDAKNFGYALTDINKDGSEELVWVSGDDTILAIFTKTESGLVMVDCFFKRYYGRLTNDNKIHITSHGGSGIVINTVYTLSENGSLIKDMCYGMDYRETESSLSYCKYVDGEQIWITEEEYNEIIAQQQAKIAEIENVVYFEQ